MEYIRFTDEQIETARRTDMLDFLQRNYGFSFKKTGKYYKCKEHDSLNIMQDRKGWVWYSKDISGASAINFLMKIENKSFKEAMEDILQGSFSVSDIYIAPKEVHKFVVLPEKTDSKYSRVFAYLCQSRCLSPKVVSDMIANKMIYQDKRGNCVFVGFDKNGKERYGSIRGTLSDVQYRGDCKGSDKRYSFSVQGTNKEKLYIFESAIDLLSHCTMENNYKKDENAYKTHSRLSLSSVSDIALDHYLKEHTEVKELSFRLDNDEAGRTATKSYIEKYTTSGYKVTCHFSKAKDVNEDLINSVKSISQNQIKTKMKR